MRLALRELVRRPGRFAVATAILTLIAALLMFLGGPRDLVPVVLFGYELAPKGLPATPPGPGEAYADASLRAEGIKQGTVVRLGPERTPIKVVGFVKDTQYSGQGTLWGSLDSWRTVLNANRPAGRVDPDVTQALVVNGDGADLASAIDQSTGGATTSRTIPEAIDALPGVSQQQRVFNQIIAVTVIIAIIVVALFFALITIERTALYGVLKALVASLIGATAALLLDAVIPAGGVPFVATLGRILSSVAFLLLAAAVGCAFSLRRALRIDPATAIGGAQ